MGSWAVKNLILHYCVIPGEDRWLCTLLVQQGWRVEYNAASDAYTNAPQDFKEFYNQRRRWGPSTMANTIDLLGSGGLTAQRNSSISKPYIVYQVISMGCVHSGPCHHLPDDSR